MVPYRIHRERVREREREREREKSQVPESNGWAHIFEGGVGGARLHI